MAASAKDCHTLTSYYVKLWKEKYQGEPTVNRVSARWDFSSLLDGMSVAQAKALLDYYFTTPPSRRHDLQWFFYNYDKLIEAMLKGQEDAAHRAKLMEESKIRAEKWRQSGKQGIADHQRGTGE